MALSFASATGNLFNRIGKIGLLVKQLKIYQTAQLTNMIDPTNGVVGQYVNEPDIQAIMGSSYIGIESATDSIIGGISQSLAAATVSRMIYRDNPQLNQTLTAGNTTASLLEIIRQMKVQSATVLAMTIGSSTTPFSTFNSNIGNGVINLSTQRPFDGRVLENAFAETLTFKCAADSYTGGTIAFNESFAVTGVGNQGDPFAFDWPLGSNCSLTIATIDGDTDTASGNVLTNSGFTNWTGSVPDNFVIDLGGALISKETALTFSTAAALKITGDGATNVVFHQLFDNSAGTLDPLSSLTQYSFCLWMRRGGAAVSGTLRVSLANAAGTAINDAAASPNAVSFDLSTLTTSYQAFLGMFRTPEALPTDYNLKIETTIPVDLGGLVYLDKMSLGLASQCYVSGPYVAMHSGNIPFQFGDYTYAQITNSRGAGGTLSTFQTLWAQLFPDMINNELLLPSSNTPSISDTLIA